MSTANTYEIIDGVRRAKAALLAGHHSIRARMFTAGGGTLIREFDCAIDELRSPHKNCIQLQSLADRARWQRVTAGAQQTPLPFPAIELVAGSRGAKIDQITFA